MNNSGKSVAAALYKFRAKPSEMLVIHDDSDLELGLYKISFGRGSGGHKGIDSIINTIGSEFTRMRIGVRSKSGKAGDFVLHRIREEDKEVLEKLFLDLRSSYFETNSK